MADLSVADYEAALDDITRRGIAAIRHTDDTHRAQKIVRRSISQHCLREQRPMKRVQPLQPAETTGHAVDGGIVQSIKARPYATLAIAGLIGFACAALRR
jgi:hypothetical protein